MWKNTGTCYTIWLVTLLLPTTTPALHLPWSRGTMPVVFGTCHQQCDMNLWQNWNFSKGTLLWKKITHKTQDHITEEWIALDCRCWAVMPSLTPWAAFVKTDKLLAVSSLFFWLLCDLHAEGKGSGKAVCVHTHLNRLQWWFVINSRLECLLFFKSCSCLSIRLTLKILYFCSADWF